MATTSPSMVLSFIADPFGEKVEELNRTEEGILVHTFDLDALERTRSAWGVFRDRRPNLYGPLKTLDGSLESRPRERSARGRPAYSAPASAAHSNDFREQR